MTVETFIHAGVSFPSLEIEHFSCSCNFDAAFCSIDITRSEWTCDVEERRLCAVCVDLYEHYEETGICCPRVVRRG